MPEDSDPLKDVNMIYTDVAGCNIVEAKTSVAKCQVAVIVRNPENHEELVTEFQTDEQLISDFTPEQSAWNRIATYLTENEIKKALEAELQQKMVVETVKKDVIEAFNEEPKDMIVEGQKLDGIFDDEPSGFEKDTPSSNKKIQAQHPLEEIDLGDGSIKRPTYESSKIGPDFKV